MRTFVIGLLASAALAGCSSVCSRAEDVFLNLQDKTSNCTLDRDVTGGFDRSRCNAGIDLCSGMDLDNVNQFLDCLDRLPECIAGQEANWSQKELQCHGSLNGVSAGCRQALQ